MFGGKQTGFTLAELLIALALLGIIAAFTIPKVLQSSAEQEKVAKLRETVSTLEQAWYNVKMTNNYGASTTLQEAIGGNLNAIRVTGLETGTDPGEVYETMPTHPCIADVAPCGTGGIVQFQNGVVVSGMHCINYGGSWTGITVPTNNNPICIDLNGIASPNQWGQDVFLGDFNPSGDFDVIGGGVYTLKPDGKNFMWGSGTEPVLNFDGSAFAAPMSDPESTVGYWLGR